MFDDTAVRSVESITVAYEDSLYADPGSFLSKQSFGQTKLDNSNKIIQIAVNELSQIFALREDGSIWKRIASTWFLVPGIPE